MYYGGWAMPSPTPSLTAEQYRQGLRDNALVKEMRVRVCFCGQCCAFWMAWEGAGGGDLTLDGAKELAGNCLTRANWIEDTD